MVLLLVGDPVDPPLEDQVEGVVKPKNEFMKLETYLSSFLSWSKKRTMNFSQGQMETISAVIVEINS
jgi:hypothetical protein